MKKLTQHVVIAPFINVNPGAVVGLSLKQYQARKHAVDTIKKATKEKQGVFDVTHPFHLKKGEVFGYDGPIDKSQASAITTEEKFAETPVREFIKDFKRYMLVEYAARYCDGLELDLKKDNDFIRDQIIEFKESESSETAKPGAQKSPKKKSEKNAGNTEKEPELKAPPPVGAIVEKMS